MKTKFLLALLTVVTVLLHAPPVRAFYDARQGRWLSRDLIEQRGEDNIVLFTKNNPIGAIDTFGLKTYPTTIIPHPTIPNAKCLKRPGVYQISKCHYTILMGHGMAHPGEMKGPSCAYGAAYGCLTGGGEYINPNEDIPTRTMPGYVVTDPVKSPGIPGAPPQPGGPVDGEDDCIDGDELRDLVDKAFSAAAEHARKTVCDKPCECKKLTVEIICVGPVEKDDKSLCGKKEVVRCPKTK